MSTVDPETEAAEDSPQATDSDTPHLTRLLSGSVSQSKLLIAFVAALGASVAPVTAYVSKRQEIELERTKQTHEEQVQDKEQMHKVRMDFLEKVVSFERDKPGDSYYRRDVLRFFASTLEPGSLQSWAVSELAAAQKEVEQVEELKGKLETSIERNSELRLEMQAKQAEAAKLASELETTRKNGISSAAEIRSLRAREDKLVGEIRSRAAQLAQQQDNAKDLEARVSAFRTLATARGPCPPGSNLQTSQGSDPSAVAACIKSAPDGVQKLSIWSVKSSDATNADELNCQCR